MKRLPLAKQDFNAPCTWKDEKFNDLSISQVGCSMQRRPLLTVLQGQNQVTRICHHLPFPHTHKKCCSLFFFFIVMRAKAIDPYTHAHHRKQKLETTNRKRIFLSSFFTPLCHANTLLQYPCASLFQCSREQSAKWSYKQMPCDLWETWSSTADSREMWCDDPSNIDPWSQKSKEEDNKAQQNGK